MMYVTCIDGIHYWIRRSQTLRRSADREYDHALRLFISSKGTIN